MISKSTIEKNLDNCVRLHVIYWIAKPEKGKVPDTYDLGDRLS